MATTLTYGATPLTLPSDLVWTDEFAWRQVEQSRRYSVTGALIVDAGAKLKGRPITLTGTDRHAWITRADLLTLLTWRALPAEVFSLVLRGEAARSVMFDHEGGAIEAAPIIEFSDPAAADVYRVVLRFIEV